MKLKKSISKKPDKIISLWEFEALNTHEQHEILHVIYKHLASEFRLDGFSHGIKMCCMIFFNHVFIPKINEFIPEYADKMNDGIILSPECIIKNYSS